MRGARAGRTIAVAEGRTGTPTGTEARALATGEPEAMAVVDGFAEGLGVSTTGGT